jgi:hypothetical protein
VLDRIWPDDLQPPQEVPTLPQSNDEQAVQ